MNLGAHIVVARRLENDPRYWLGAALPDIASMGGFRLLGSTANEQVAAGIAFHHRTDEAFHHHPWFLAIQLPLRQALLDAGVGRGPARAVAHVGPELLLDAWLLESEAATIDRAIGTVPDLKADLAPLVRDEHLDRWTIHLDRVASWRPSDDDQRVEAVARRLHRILQRRPRLALDDEHIGVIAEHLHPVNDHIGATTVAFIDDLVAQLARR